MIRACTTCGCSVSRVARCRGGGGSAATTCPLNNLVVDGVVRATTPCFFGADPASSPLLGPAPLRPLAGAEDLARELVRSLDPDQAAQAVLLDRAPSDIVGGNRSLLSDGDQVIHLRDTGVASSG